MDASHDYLIVVRADQTALFQALQQEFAREPHVTIIRDQRRRDRRVISQDVPCERRRTDRRAPPPANWYTHGFIVAEASERTRNGHPASPDPDPELPTVPFELGEDGIRARIRRAWDSSRRRVALRAFAADVLMKSEQWRASRRPATESAAAPA